MKENLNSAFEALKEGTRALQAEAASGKLEAVELGLSELLFAVEELQNAVMLAVPAEA